MLKRTMLVAAIAAAALALQPASASAQARGMEQAATAAASGLTTSAENGRPTSMPSGLANSGQAQPPGMALTRSAQASEPPTEPDSGSDECPIQIVNGIPVDCNGNPVG